jgi:hypothetical protein
VRVIGGEHRVNAGQFGERDHAARGVAPQNQPARKFYTALQRGLLESIPAPRRPRVVAADEGEALTALRHEMARHRAAGLVVAETGDGIDRGSRKIPGFDNRNARTAQQPCAVLGRGRAHHDDRLGSPRQQRSQHMIFPRRVVARLRQDHGVARWLQLVGQPLHGIGENRIGDGRHQHAHGTGARAG